MATIDLNVLLGALLIVAILETQAMVIYRLSLPASVFAVTFIEFFALSISYYGGVFGISLENRFLLGGIFLSLLPAALLTAHILQGIRAARSLFLTLVTGFIAYTLTWTLGLTLSPLFSSSPLEVLPTDAIWILGIMGILSETAGFLSVIPLYTFLGRRARLPHWARTTATLLLAPLGNAAVMFLGSLFYRALNPHYDIFALTVAARVVVGLFLAPGVLLFLKRNLRQDVDASLAAGPLDALGQLTIARKSLQEAEARYRALFSTAPDTIILFDREGIIREVNPRAEQVLGYEAGDLPGLPVWRIWGPTEDEKESARRIKDRLKTIQPSEVTQLEGLARRADGSVFPTEISLTAVSGTAPGFLAIGHDLTRQKSDRAKLEMQVAELNTLAEVAHIASSARNLPALLKASVDRVGDLVEASICYITLWDEASQQMRFAAASGSDHDKIRGMPAVAEAEKPTMTWHALEESHPVIVHDFPKSPYFKSSHVLGPAIQSAAALPLIADGRKLGALIVGHFQPHTFAPEEVGTLERAANLIALAIARMQLLEEARERHRQAESLRQVGIAFGATLDYETVLDRILESLSQIMPCDAANIQLIRGGAACVIRSRGYETFGLDALVTDLPLLVDSTPLLKTIAETRHPLVVSDTHEEPRWRVPEAWGERPKFWRSWLGAPIVVRNEVIGFINADSARPGAYSERHAELLAALAGHAASALENARLYEQMQRRLKELTAIYQAGQRLQRLHSPQLLAQEAINSLADILGYDHCSVMLTDEATRDLRTLALNEWGRDEAYVDAELERIADFNIRLGMGLTGWVAETGEGVRIGDVRQDPRYLAVREDILSELCVPLKVGDKTIGVINVESTRPDAYSEADQRLLETVAAQIAISIQNARLYEDLQIAYEQLKASQDDALRSERLRALGQMASGIAHDFNNVLTPVVGYLELVLEHPDLPEDVRGDVERARRGALAASGIVARLREFYRPREAAEDFAPVDMSKVIGEAVDLTRPRWRDIPQEAGTVIDMRLELGQVARVHGNASALRDLLTNLIMNAVDAMPEGGTITIRTQSADDLVLLTVSDTGLGMDEQARRRAFEPFFSTKGSQGTGLGLSICYGIVQRHGGRIYLDSNEGRGTTFFVRLPTTAGTLPVGPDADLPSLPRLTILLVDDEEPVLAVVSRILSRAGHKVITASGGQEGIDKFAPHEVDVVITDLGMPQVTGREVARAVKARSSHTPVILLTGWGAKVGQERGAPEGVDCILNKPVQSTDLHRALARALGLPE